MKNAIDYTAFLGFYQKIQRENPDIAVHRVNASCFDRNSLPPGVRCAGGVRKLSVMPDGAVFPCNLFHGLEGFRLGNIFRDSFEDIWSNQRLDLFRRHQENSCSIYTCKNHDIMYRRLPGPRLFITTGILMQPISDASSARS